MSLRLELDNLFRQIVFAATNPKVEKEIFFSPYIRKPNNKFTEIFYSPFRRND